MVLDHQAKVNESLEQKLAAFDPDGYYDLEKYEILPLPERQAEDVRPSYSQAGQHRDFDAGSLRSGASRPAGASRKPPSKSKGADQAKYSVDAGRSRAVHGRGGAGADREGTGSVMSSMPSDPSLGQKPGKTAHASAGLHSK